MAFEFVRRLFQRLPQPDPDDPGFYRHSAAPTATALAAIPAAYAAIGLLASSLAQLPRTVVRQDDPLDDYWTPEPTHPVSVLLRYPSRLVDPWLFWEWLFRGLFTHGNAYAWIRRDGAGRPLELVPATCVHSQWATTRRVAYDLELWGVADAGGAPPGIRAWASDVIALHGPGFEGLSSPSPIQYAARRTLEAMAEATTHQQALLQGVNIRTAIKADPSLVRLNKEQLDAYRESLKKTYEGARKAGQVPVLPPGFDLATAGGLSATDLQLIELLKWSVEDIARVYDVPPRRLGHYHAGVRFSTSIEADSVEFERRLTSHIRRVEAQLSATLLSRDDAERGLVVCIPSDRIRAGSWSERVAAVDQAVAKAGVITINEGRRHLRLPPRPDGDRLLQPKGAPAQTQETVGAPDDDAA